MASTNTGPPPPEYHRRGSNPDLQVPISQVQRMSMEDEERPLPDGWVRQFDRNSSHHFYVDTHAHPPRSIWVHPFEDPQWQQEHASSVGPPPGPPPGAQAQSPTSPDSKLRKDRPLEKGDSKGHQAAPSISGGQSSTSGSNEKKGFFTKIKDDLVGTKEERAAAKEKKAQMEREQQERYLERRRLLAQQAASQQAQYPNNPIYSNYGYRGQPAYAAPQGAYGRRRTGYGGGIGLPLLGGLGGGLLLGDMLGGGFGGGGFGGDGGGGFDGGGGGFDGGGGGFDGGGGGFDGGGGGF